MLCFIYAADHWCEDFGRSIRRDIKRTGHAPEDPRDETSYDSDEYPKGPTDHSDESADYPCHCGAGKDCINAITLDSGHKIGAWLENPLTSHGVLYVACAIRDDPGEVTALWAELYASELADLEGDDDSED